MTNKKLVVYILSYNRLNYIFESINSILNQTTNNFDLIVSENSTDPLIYEKLKNYFQNKITIVKRSPSLPSLDHINLVIQEAVKNYDYCMIFHDDDILFPNAIEKMLPYFDSYNVAALGCNALIIDQNKLTHKIYSQALSKNLIITQVSDLIKSYIVRSQPQVPFPSYIYNCKYIKNLKFNSQDGGKHADASFLTEIVKINNILWVAEPLMYYRTHQNNDSKSINLSDIRKLCYYFFKQSPQLFPAIIIFYFKFILKKLKALLSR